MRVRLLCCMLCVVSLLSCKGRGDAVVVDAIDTAAEVIDTLPRTSVTFIMGEDNWAYNQYYTLANHYYRMNRDERTSVVVEGLRSLSQVLEYLQNNPPADGRPYGLVNVVSHGNEFVDLQMKVTPEGGRTSADAIFEALVDGSLVSPDSSVVDSLTTVYLHGCAVGQNYALLAMLARAFGAGHGVTVKASRMFEYYAYLSGNRNPQSVRHYFARTWYAFYHSDSAMDEGRMVWQLRQRYPSDTMNWREGLRRRFQDNPSQLYHYSFEVPCTYEEVYDVGVRPVSVNGPRQRRQWLEEHSEFAELLAVTHIPLRYFQMKFYRRTYIREDEELVYGLLVKAKAGVVCLIQPLTATDSLGNPFMPFRPEDGDTTVFAYATYREPRILGPCQWAETEPARAETFLCRKKDVPL